MSMAWGIDLRAHVPMSATSRPALTSGDELCHTEVRELEVAALIEQ